MRVVVIMAGGSGERFWPLSRRNHPKQLLNLSRPDRSLLEEAVERSLSLAPREQIFVATGRHLEDAIRQAKLGIPDANVIAEPCKRNTAGCLCYAAAIMLSRFGCEASAITMGVLTSDHRIPDTASFAATDGRGPLPQRRARTPPPSNRRDGGRCWFRRSGTRPLPP